MSGLWAYFSAMSSCWMVSALPLNPQQRRTSNLISDCLLHRMMFGKCSPKGSSGTVFTANPPLFQLSLIQATRDKGSREREMEMVQYMTVQVHQAPFQ